MINILQIQLIATAFVIYEQIYFRRRIVIYLFIPLAFCSSLPHCCIAAQNFHTRNERQIRFPLFSADASGVVTRKCRFTRTCPGNTFFVFVHADGG